MVKNIIKQVKNFLKGQKKETKRSSWHTYEDGGDVWEDIKNEIGEFIPKGISLYGEYLGFDKNGKYIQGDYDYGCSQSKGKIEIYRITQTSPDGLVTEFSYPQIEEFCSKMGLTPSYIFYTGRAVDMYDLDVNEHWNEEFVKCLERDYNEKKCFMCKNSVPEEGIVVRKESLFNCESYKLKSFAFLEKESKDLDKGEINIEDNQDES